MYIHNYWILNPNLGNYPNLQHHETYMNQQDMLIEETMTLH